MLPAQPPDGGQPVQAGDQDRPDAVGARFEAHQDRVQQTSLLYRFQQRRQLVFFEFAQARADLDCVNVDENQRTGEAGHPARRRDGRRNDVLLRTCIGGVAVATGDAELVIRVVRLGRRG